MKGVDLSQFQYLSENGMLGSHIGRSFCPVQARLLPRKIIIRPEFAGPK